MMGADNNDKDLPDMRENASTSAQPTPTPVKRKVRLGMLKFKSWLCRDTLDEKFRYAVKMSQMAWAEQLLQQGANIDFAPVEVDDPYLDTGYCLRHARTRMTALHVACTQGDLETAAWLLDRGADTELRDTWATTPVQLAAERSFLSIVALLADRGADMQTRMPVYSTYSIDWTPKTVLEHVQDEGYQGNEHLAHLAGLVHDAMQINTVQPCIHEVVSQPNPRRF